MKTNCWLILGTMLATTAVAQVNTNKLPEIPPPATTVAAPAPMAVSMSVETKTNAPVKKAATKAKKKTVKKAAPAKPVEKKAPLALVVLVPGPATVAADNVNLRGQAGLKGEVVGHVKKGDTVSVLAQINLDKPKAGEPAQWAKVALPAGTKVWVDSHYLDASNNVVSAKKLNLRGGPGENYSVLGVIEKGAVVTPVSTKEHWTEIDTPASAFAFVAASYLKQDGSSIDTSVPPNVPTPPTPPVVENVPPPTPVIPPTPTTVADAQPIAPPATTPPATPETAAVTPPAVPPAPVTPVTPAMILPEPTLALDDTNLPPPPPRIVTHEGNVRSSVSLVAPTYYELYDPANNKAINYLYTTSTNLNLGRYNGLHITVTGEEALDARWKDTPVLTIQKIYVLSDPKKTEPPLKPIRTK